MGQIKQQMIEEIEEPTLEEEYLAFRNRETVLVEREEFQALYTVMLSARSGFRLDEALEKFDEIEQRNKRLEDAAWAYGKQKFGW